MTRYWRIYRTFFVTSFARELEFRANFFAKIAQNFVWVFFFVMILLVVYGKTNTVAGWSFGDSIVLGATCFAMNALIQALFLSLQEIPQQVRQGTLDFVITKPIDTQFWISTRKFNFDQVGSFCASMLGLWYGIYRDGLHPGVTQCSSYIVLVFASLTIFYSFYLALMTLGIWLVRVDNLWVLGETVMQISRYPLDIYNVGIQRFFTFTIPLAFVATIPARQLVRGFDGRMLGLGIVWAMACLILSRVFWNYALRHYNSASS